MMHENFDVIAPAHVEKMEAICQRRRWLARINCILCERRIGWLSYSQLKQYLEEHEGLCICMLCARYRRRGNGAVPEAD